MEILREVQTEDTYRTDLIISTDIGASYGHIRDLCASDLDSIGLGGQEYPYTIQSVLRDVGMGMMICSVECKVSIWETKKTGHPPYTRKYLENKLHELQQFTVFIRNIQQDYERNPSADWEAVCTLEHIYPQQREKYRQIWENREQYLKRKKDIMDALANHDYQ